MASLARLALRRPAAAAAAAAARAPALIARRVHGHGNPHSHAEVAARDHRGLRLLMWTGVIVTVPSAYLLWASNKRKEAAASKVVKKTVSKDVATAEQTSRPEPLPSSVQPTAAISAAAPVPAAEPVEPATPSAPVEAAAPLAPTPSAKLAATYVLVGAGTATASALRAIRKRDAHAQILIIGDEPEAPYMRPPLSKELWFTDDPSVAHNLRFKDWSGNEKSLYFEAEGALEPVDGSSPLPTIGDDEKGRAFLLAGRKVVALDVDHRIVTLDNGQQVEYGKLLLATGGVPRQLGMVKALPDHVRERVTTFRKVADFRELHQYLTGPKHVAIIGGGFLGSELAVALARQKQKNPDLTVTQIFPEEGNMGLVFPRYLSQWTTGKLRDEGVTVVAKTAVVGIHEHTSEDGKGTGKVALELDNGSHVVADRVIVAVGIEPNVELARSAGLEIDEVRGGIMVNAELEARSNVFVAGDVTSYHDIALGRRRVEHHDHAVVSGQAAGENMAGAHKAYTHQSMFWSDLGPKIGYEAVGILDSRLTTVGVWAKAKPAAPAADAAPTTGTTLEGAASDAPAGAATEGPTAPSADDYGRGAVFYLRNKRVVGVLMWNLFDRVPVARKIINEGKTYDNFSELAKLMRVHD